MISCAHNCGYQTTKSKRLTDHIRLQHAGQTPGNSRKKREFRGHLAGKGKKK